MSARKLQKGTTRMIEPLARGAERVGATLGQCALLVTLLVASFGNAARADSLRDTFARGNAAYARADYATASAEYETLLESGVADAAVSYNLASAYAASQKYGAAIRYFERALAQAPGADDAERGLKLARDLLGERQVKERGEAIVAERPPLSRAVFANFAENTLAIGLLASCVLGSAALIALYFARAEAARLALGITSSFFLLSALLSGYGLWAKADFGAPGVRAIVLTDRAPVRDGPDPAARLRTELNEGEAVRILSKEGQFARIRLPRGGDGYAPLASVGEI